MKHLLFAAERLELAGIGTRGKDLFIGKLPARAQTGILLLDPTIGAELDSGQEGFVHHQFQAIVRGTEAEVDYELAMRISRELRYNRVEYEDIFILKMEPLTLPATFPVQESETMETAVRFRVAYGALL